MAAYAFPLTSIGTVGLVYGMYLCAYIIEISTEELTWVPKYPQGKHDKLKQLRILWVQSSQTVGDQGFGSYAIYAPFKENAPSHLMTSHRRQDKEFAVKLHRLTIAATALSIVGTLWNIRVWVRGTYSANDSYPAAFILQFVGYVMGEPSAAVHASLTMDELCQSSGNALFCVDRTTHCDDNNDSTSSSDSETHLPIAEETVY